MIDAAPTGTPRVGPHYKWVVLSNTTVGVLLSSMTGTSLIIALPVIFRGIKLNPLVPANSSYLLWIMMGYMLVSAAVVVTVGRIGDIFGRVRMYNLGFAWFTVGAVLLSLRVEHRRQRSPGAGHPADVPGRRWGALLMANSAAIITDAFPSDQLGFALGINMVAAIVGSFLGIVVGGLLSQLGWRWVFLANVPIGAFGTIWAYLKLKDIGVRIRARIDWAGNLAFAGGLAMLLVGVTYGIEPYGTSLSGWGNPFVLGMIAGGRASCWPASSSSRCRVEGSDVPALALPHPGVRLRQPRRVPGIDRPRRPDVHADDLVPGHLAAPARLQLRRHPALGGHLHDPVHPRIRGRRSHLRQAVGPLRGPSLRHRRDAAGGGHLRADDDLPGQLQLLAVRRGHARLRDRRRPLRLPQHRRRS